MPPAPVASAAAEAEGANVVEDGNGVPAPLSSGACRALGIVLKRLLDDSRDHLYAPAKRPRVSGGLGLVLGCDEEVAGAAEAEEEERVRDREGKRARMQFEAQARIVPDAATGAKRERDLRETATKGVVALFNAVAKAQKAASLASGGSKGTKQASGEVVSKEGFMEMIRAGVKREGGREEKGGSSDDDVGDSEDDAGAEWMRDDFMTKGSRKLKNFGKDQSASDDDDQSSEGDADSAGQSESQSESEGEDESSTGSQGEGRYGSSAESASSEDRD